MSRNKRSRTPGSQPEEVMVTRNRSESNVEGRLQKRVNKRKGLKAGSRHSDGSDNKQHFGSGNKKDPRIGSKKPVPLIVEPKKKKNKQERQISAQQELDAIQNDAQLMVLIDRLENGEKLGAGLQTVVDQKLDRLEVLMKQLGIFEQEFEDDFEEVEDDAELIPTEHKVEKSQKKKVSTDEELLSQFSNMDLDEFK